MIAHDGAAPIIVDTDIGGDPDDTIALVLAARLAPELALVVTSDEFDGERARFARYLLDLCGRADVPVVAGRQLGGDAHFCVEDLAPSRIGRQPSDVLVAVERVLATAQGGAARWVGIGPLSNLADVLRLRPEWATALELTQMGGALRYRDPSRAEHNFRRDPGAVRVALAAFAVPTLVTSDVTFNPATEVVANGAVHRSLTHPGRAAWAEPLRAQLDRWFGRFHPGTMQHDGLTLSVALGLPFVEFGETPVSLGDDARMTSAEDGQPMLLSTGADYPSFNHWLRSNVAPWSHPMG